MSKRRIWRKTPKDQPPGAALPNTVAPSELMEDSLSPSIAENRDVLKAVFRDCSDVAFRDIKTPHVTGMVVFIDGIVKAENLRDGALLPLLENLQNGSAPCTPDNLEDSVLTLPQLSAVKTYSDVIEALLKGNATLFLEGFKESLILDVKGGTRRGVEEPATEASIRGPREGFIESLGVNLGLLRFKIKSQHLKTVNYTIGKQTKTNVVLTYLDGVASPDVIAEVKKRIERIEIDGVLESAYIEELIEDDPYSPFPQMQYSERPDTISAQLLEGKFAIFVDGTPFVLTGPTVFWQFFQASEDYYERYLISNLIRWLRMTFLFLALYLPGIYIAVTTFHQDMLPTNLLLSVATARESIPFPALVEALIMEISFEALREAGVRLPKTVGQAVSILGALVIGQAAVQAGIVSAPMVIVVSLTGIASFTIPRFNAAISVRMLRFPLMFMAGAFGLFGLMIGTMWIVTHMCSLRSFGVPYLSGLAPSNLSELKDVLIRVPWWKMNTRPTSVSRENSMRMEPGIKPAPPDPERQE